MSEYGVEFDLVPIRDLAHRALLAVPATQAALLLYERLILDAKDGVPYRTDAELGALLGWGEKTVRRALKVLRTIGVVVDRKATRRSRTLVVRLYASGDTVELLKQIAAGTVAVDVDGVLTLTATGEILRRRDGHQDPSREPEQLELVARDGHQDPSRIARGSVVTVSEGLAVRQSGAASPEKAAPYVVLDQIENAAETAKSISRESSYNNLREGSVDTESQYSTTLSTDRPLKHGEPCPCCGQRYDKRSNVSWEKDPTEHHATIMALWNHLRTNFPFAKNWKMNDRRFRAAKRLLEHGFLPSQLETALDQAMKSPFWTGKGKSGGIMLDFPAVFGKPETVDRLLADAEAGTGVRTHNFNPSLGASQKKGTAEEF